MDWKILLGSTVIASIIAGIISYITASKNSSLEYITADRREWRKELRDIAKRLYSANYNYTKRILVEIKMRINAFGKGGKEQKYLEDSHIWEIISEIEEKEDEKLFYYQKNLLIDYLSLNLKYDWERSKVEVTGNRNKKISYIFFFLSLLLLGVFDFFVGKKQGVDIEIKIVIISFIPVIIFWVTWLILYYIEIGKVIKTSKKAKTRWYNISIFVVGYVVLCVVGGAVVVVLSEEHILDDIYGCVCLIPYIVAVNMALSTQYEQISFASKYINTIENLKEEYQEVKGSCN